MNKIIALLIILIFLAGCELTGKVTQDIEKVPTQEQKDQSLLISAIESKDISNCYNIQTQPIRESCFMKLAKELKDPSICKNLLGNALKDKCKSDINN